MTARSPKNIVELYINYSIQIISRLIRSTLNVVNLLDLGVVILFSPFLRVQIQAKEI